jgi:Fe-S oxidoreductase
MCNNNGHCRQFDVGTMCPSFRVTREEQHLTRGRANTLRLALAGRLDADGLASEAVREALELCVGCKGCKRECPTGVDMARMKIEFLAHYKARHGHTLRDRLIGRLPDYAAFLARVPGLANLRDTLPGAKALSERLLGLSAKRSLPRWRADTFWRARDGVAWANGAEALQAHAAGKKAVILFVDTFNGAFEPENALACARVLAAAGYRVHAVGKPKGQLCCGRTYLSVGMVDKARAKARELVGALEEFARHGLPIVGLEPSCLLTLRDEACALGLGEAAQTVAAQALLFEEFLAREARAGRFAPKLKAAEQPILVHAHCHQKAFGAVAPILEVLRLIPGANPRLIESSCCGMAGSFGYEAEHHAVSMQMAELTLLPAVRAAPDAVVVADGTSCRHQIWDGTRRRALHAALILDRHAIETTA